MKSFIILFLSTGGGEKAGSCFIEIAETFTFLPHEA
jgi:hypothetical protein